MLDKARFERATSAYRLISIVKKMSRLTNRVVDAAKPVERIIVCGMMTCPDSA
jgi:hypothetical protein